MRFPLVFFCSLLLCSIAFAQPINDELRRVTPTLAGLKIALQTDFNPHRITKDGNTYLHLAARRNLPLHIKELRKIKAVNKLLLQRNVDGKTALEEAIERGNHEAVVALIHNFPEIAGVRIERLYGWCLLHLAVNHNHERIARTLIEAGVIVDTPDDDGWTPMHLAATLNLPRMINLLAEAGHPLTSLDRKRRTPIRVAYAKRATAAQSALRRLGSVSKCDVGDAEESRQCEVLELARVSNPGQEVVLLQEPAPPLEVVRAKKLKKHKKRAVVRLINEEIDNGACINKWILIAAAGTFFAASTVFLQ